MVTAISLIRSLARAGVDVRLLCSAGAAPSYSRYARRLPTDSPGSQPEAWLRYLLGPESEELRGAVLLACNDDAIELLMDNREALSDRYVLDVCDPGAQRAMLDKLATYRIAAEAGIPTPRFWPAETAEQVQAHRDEYVYPLMMKPLLAHQFKKIMPGKYLMVDDLDELLAAYRRFEEHGVGVVLLEVIPGPDDLLCSYYTYLDEEGDAAVPLHQTRDPQISRARGLRLLPHHRLEPRGARPRVCGSFSMPDSRASPTWSSSAIRATAASSSSSATRASPPPTGC